jgi:hypothetical protein
LLAVSGLHSRLDLFVHKYFAVALLHPPTRHRIEGRPSNSLAAAQAETGMMPGTPHGVVDDQSFGEWPSIMRTGRSYREELVSAACKYNGLATDRPTEQRAIGDIAELDA